MSELRHSLSLANVSKRYADVVAVDSVSLKVERGQFLTLLGPSGSGKTTILMAIAGFTTPSEGEICLDRTPISRCRRSGAISAWCSRAMRCSRT